MQSRRITLLAGIVLCLLVLLPLKGYAVRGGNQDGYREPSVRRLPLAGHFNFTPGQQKKVACSWTCLNGNTGSATTETVSQCYAACAGACGGTCGPA